MNYHKIILIVLLFASFTTIAEAQRTRNRKQKVKQRFSAGILGGFNFAQIDGDSYTGYDKIGLTGGIKVSTHLLTSLSFDVEFLYTEKGSKIENQGQAFRVNRDKERIIHLAYIEVPLLLNLKTGDGNSNFSLQGGFIIGKKIGSEITEVIHPGTFVSYGEVENEFKRTELSALFGGSYDFGKQISIGLRFNYGLSKFYFDEDPQNDKIDGILFGEPDVLQFLRNYSISVMAMYKIF